MKIDWVRKLTSRKLWMSIASFTMMMIVYFTGSESEAQQIGALIMAGATIIGYIFAEGLADSANVPQIDAADAIEVITEIDTKKE